MRKRVRESEREERAEGVGKFESGNRGRDGERLRDTERTISQTQYIN